MYSRTYSIGSTRNIETLDATVYWLSESAQYHVWRRSVAVKSLGVSMKLYSTSGPVTTGMGDRLWRTNHAPQYFSKPPRPTQPPTLSGTGNEYQLKCGDALRLGSKGRYGSFNLLINVWVAGKTVIPR